VEVDLTVALWNCTFRWLS